MSAKHTPGPWYWSGDSLIQTSHVTRDVWVIPRNAADRALLAAAPELLEALRCAADVLEAGDALEQTRRRYLAMARAAIAKAEGK